MNLIDAVKTTGFKYINNLYKDYNNNNNILLIKEDSINNIIRSFYETNIKDFKNYIRNTIKNDYQSLYNSSAIENILLEIHQDKELYINKLIDEIKFIQKKNKLECTIPIINNSLNLNIAIVNNFIVINSTNSKNVTNHDELYNSINEYKFLYSLENIILEEINDTNKINVIKELIFNKESVNACFYYMKNNNNETITYNNYN